MRNIIKVLTTVTFLGIILFLKQEKIVKADEFQEEQTDKAAIKEMEIEDQVKTFINVEGIEFSSEEEAFTYLAETYDLAVPYSSQLKTSCSADLINDELVVSYTTTSGIGTASLLGIKNVYVQYRTPGSNLVGNHMPSGTFTITNDFNVTDVYTYSNLVRGYEYRGKQTHFIIVNGVEYTYTTYTLFVSYYC